MHARRVTLAALLVAVVACQSAPTSRGPVLVTSSTKPRTVAEQRAHCTQMVAKARANPGIDVEKVPEPLRRDPPPIRRPVPPGVMRKDGSGEVKIEVVVDTLGRPQMKTFTVVSASHPWLANSVREAIGKWRFSPAELEGCKVPRLYRFSATASPRGTRRGSE